MGARYGSRTVIPRGDGSASASRGLRPPGPPGEPPAGPPRYLAVVSRGRGLCLSPRAHPPSPAGRASARLAQLSRRHREHLEDRRVELPDAGEAGRERDLRQRQRGRLGQHPGRLGALRAGDGQRPGAQFGGDQPAHLALLVAEPAGQSFHAVPVHHAVGDEPHRAPHHVGPDVPFRRPGGGVRAAPLARAIPGLLGRGGGTVVPHVLALGSDRRARRAAVDARRAHRDEEDPVEAGVLADRRLVLLLVIEPGRLGQVPTHASHNARPRRLLLAEIGQPPRRCGR